MLDARVAPTRCLRTSGAKNSSGGGGAPLREGYPCGEKIIAKCAAPLRTPLKGVAQVAQWRSTGFAPPSCATLKSGANPISTGHFSSREPDFSFVGATSGANSITTGTSRTQGGAKVAKPNSHVHFPFICLLFWPILTQNSQKPLIDGHFLDLKSGANSITTGISSIWRQTPYLSSLVTGAVRVPGR